MLAAAAGQILSLLRHSTVMVFNNYQLALLVVLSVSFYWPSYSSNKGDDHEAIAQFYPLFNQWFDVVEVLTGSNTFAWTEPGKNERLICPHNETA